MRTRLALVVLVAVVLCACTGAQASPEPCPTCAPTLLYPTILTCPPSPEPQVVEKIVKETVIVEREVTRIVEVQANVSATPEAESTDAGVLDGLVRRFEDWDRSLDMGGVVITVAGGVFSTMEWVRASATDEQVALWNERMAEDVQTLVVLWLEIENTTNEVMTIYPDQDGILVVGNEQVEANFWLSDSVGDIQPGVMVEASVIFGLERYGLDDITSMRYIVESAHDENLDHPADEDYVFEIDTPLEPTG